MKTKFSTSICSLLVMATFFSCEKNKVEEPLAGKPGNPRLNLVFTNEENVDLDLHVLTPNGKEIYYSNLSADGGELDVDCKCSTCPSGPNENVFWVEGTAPPGIYKYWVEYYNHCSISGSVSNYTLRRLTNSKVEETFTGTLSFDKQKSPIYTFEIKPWYSNLPDCPCKYEDVQRLTTTVSPAGKWEVTNGSYLTQYHYGASFEARWTPSIGGQSGQQCTYDNNGNLITGGIAGGSVDSVAPGSGYYFNSHYCYDILPWGDMSYLGICSNTATIPCWEYMRLRPTNNTLSCSPNIISGIEHMRTLIGNMTCEEATLLIRSAKETTPPTVDVSLRNYIIGLPISLTQQQCKTKLQAWKVNVSCFSEPKLCSVLNKAINNL